MQTIDVLEKEVAKLRSMADKIEAVIIDLRGETETRSDKAHFVPPTVPPSARSWATPPTPASGPYVGMTQKDAIVKAIKIHGPLTTTELHKVLNEGGQSFAKVSYVTAIIARLKGVVTRNSLDKIELIEKGNQDA